MDKPNEQLSGELAEKLASAETLADQVAFVRACSDAFADDDLWERGEHEASDFLREREVAIPDGLAIRLLPDPHEMPSPDYEFFSIRLTRCRTVWVKKSDEPGYEQVQFCRGIEIIPHPLPPIARTSAA